MPDTSSNAFRIAEEKIEAAHQNTTRELELVGRENSKLVELPGSLAKLEHLESLRLDNNDLTTLPEWFGRRLKRLQELNLDSNQFTNLPNCLRHLTRLRGLGLATNQLASLPEWIAQLNQLEDLNIHGDNLRKLPDSIGDLKKLRSLRAAGNQFADLPESVSQLAELRELFLSSNELKTLPDGFGMLTALRKLDLERNQLTSLPESLGRLQLLESLDLASNQLRELPESLKDLKSLKQLFLHHNKGLGISSEILGSSWYEVVEGRAPADPQAILAFYFGQRKKSATPLNEVKLLLVGHGRVGKTSISKALRGIVHDEREPETPGIERHSLPLVSGRSNITAHIWDFGGQEFLHQTHQFFFSERSIYLVVLTGRQGRPMHEAEYWLRLIRTYGTGSPVVIALNQIKAHPFTVDEHFLIENYPEIKAVVKTDCEPHFGIEALRKLLGKLAISMPSVKEKIDPSWARVRTRLEDMKESFVTFSHYREICAEEGVKTEQTQENLATILDCLGIALNYRNDPRLRDTSVLKPRWLVDGIYTILRWLHKHETDGEMRLADFPKALKSKKTYPPEMHQFLLALMEKFELCFPLDSEEGIYLVPGLLNANQPFELKKFMAGRSRRLQFRYEDVRPPGLLPRFIVRSHTLSNRQPRLAARRCAGSRNGACSRTWGS